MGKTDLNSTKVLAHVQHFVNPAGERLFADWFEHVGELLKREARGLLSIRRIASVAGGACCNVLVEFDSLENMKHWAASQAHADMLAKLTPYAQRSYESNLFQIMRQFSAESAD